MKKSSIVVLLSIILFSQNGQAVEVKPMTRMNTIQFLQDAFLAQLSLADQHRSLDEIEHILNEYFTPSYSEKFIKEHILLEKDGYIMLGSDVFDYFIPFYSYDERTKMMTENDKIVVYEYFNPFFDGPVSWKEHYEVVTLKLDGQAWKISHIDVTNNLPK